MSVREHTQSPCAEGGPLARIITSFTSLVPSGNKTRPGKAFLCSESLFGLTFPFEQQWVVLLAGETVQRLP